MMEGERSSNSDTAHNLLKSTFICLEEYNDSYKNIVNDI